MAAKGGKKQKMDLIAGIIVLLVTVLLIVALVVGLQQFAVLLQANATSAPTVPTVPTTITEPPAPTLVKNPFEPADFAYRDGYMTCLTAESWLGVDVSEHQGEIDWTQVAQTPVKFAMVRLAYRGWGSEGRVRADARGVENLKGAADAGLQVGVYFFSQAISVEEAIEEAQFLLNLLDGRTLDFPVVFDWETVSSEDARTANMDRKTLNACALAFCETIEAAGYDAMVYFNPDMAKWMFDLMPIQEAGYGFWLAMYTDNMNFSHRVDMWQYTSKGSVAGIRGNVDLNLYFPEQ